MMMAVCTFISVNWAMVTNKASATVRKTVCGNVVVELFTVATL